MEHQFDLFGGKTLIYLFGFLLISTSKKIDFFSFEHFSNLKYTYLYKIHNAVFLNLSVAILLTDGSQVDCLLVYTGLTTFIFTTHKTH